ncbi:MAG: precorrin-6Y C5,15-methyltransferase (decarboxylating) subunit CbiT [Methanobacteriaceae archaeon]|nr:precorrin-6Y C5,15-methyltransferase (decarboxylating) subunit CbiT [Candidatus Methanorudis spinitermitis]
MIKDEDFISSKKVPGPSKEEIRCLILCKSQVSSNDLVVDIGCGTGGITTEMAKRAKKVIAIDKNSKAIELTKQNIKKHGVAEKVDLIKNDGISALKSIENMDVAIVGGSSEDLDEILELAISKLNPNGRVIITAILLNTKLEAIEKLKENDLSPEIIEVNVSRGHILKRGVMMKAENPIAIIYSKI